MTSYVIDKNKGWVAHEGTHESCEQWVRHTEWGGFGSSTDYVIADGAKSRDAAIRSLRGAK